MHSVAFKGAIAWCHASCHVRSGVNLDEYTKIERRQRRVAGCTRNVPDVGGRGRVRKEPGIHERRRRAGPGLLPSRVRLLRTLRRRRRRVPQPQSRTRGLLADPGARLSCVGRPKEIRPAVIFRYDAGGNGPAERLVPHCCFPVMSRDVRLPKLAIWEGFAAPGWQGKEF